MKLRQLFGWDLCVALLTALALHFLIPEPTRPSFATDMVLLEVQVVSIVFAVYLAALALILTSGSETFVVFLEIECDSAFTRILGAYKFTLWLLMAVLVIELLAYGYYKTVLADSHLNEVSRPAFIAINSGFAWALGAVFSSALDAIIYFRKRVAFAIAADELAKKPSRHPLPNDGIDHK